MRPNQEFISSLKCQANPGLPFDITSTSAIRSTLGIYTLLTFSNAGTFTIDITGTGTAEALVVAGGGGGNGGSTSVNGNKGGGGGQVKQQNITISESGTKTNSIVVGAGGAVSSNGSLSQISATGVTVVICQPGLGTGVSGTSKTVGAEATDIYDSNVKRSGGGGGSDGNGQAQGQGGSGVSSNINGLSVEYGRGGFGGGRSSVQKYTNPISANEGWLEYNGAGAPIVHNALSGLFTSYGSGGNGGARTNFGTTYTANASAGAKGIIIIKFIKII